MKIKIYLFLILANLFVFTSCNNSNSNNSYVDGPLIGKWKCIEETGDATASAYFDFRSNGKLYVTLVLVEDFEEIMINENISMSDYVSVFNFEYSDDKLVLTNSEVQYQGKTIMKQEPYYCEFHVTQLTEHTLDMTCTKLEMDNIDAFSQQIVIGHEYHLTR